LRWTLVYWRYEQRLRTAILYDSDTREPAASYAVDRCNYTSGSLTVGLVGGVGNGRIESTITTVVVVGPIKYTEEVRTGTMIHGRDSGQYFRTSIQER
jgi:hypothetical protein